MNSNLLPSKQSQASSRKIFLIGISTSLLISLNIQPIRANISNIFSFLNNGIFGNILTQLSSIFPELSSVPQWISKLQNSINDPCSTTPILFATPSEPGWCRATVSIVNGNPNINSISTILKSVAGQMGLPDIGKARSNIQQQVNSEEDSPDLFLSNPEYYAIDIGNTSDRAATSLNAQTVLSIDGQQDTQNQIDQSSQVVQSIASTSDEAQGYTSTQDVVKALVRMNAEQAVMTAMSQVSSLRSRTDAQLANVNLANISRSIDQQNRENQVNSTVDGYFLLNLSAQSNLF